MSTLIGHGLPGVRVHTYITFRFLRVADDDAEAGLQCV